VRDLDVLNDALNLTLLENSLPFGAENKVYISLPSDDPDCADLLTDLPLLPPWLSYACVPESDLQNIDGTGWIPVDFNISTGAPLSQLPIDPGNNSETLEYYSLSSNDEGWELNALFGSEAFASGGNKDVAGKDGGDTTSLFERGNILTLAPDRESPAEWNSILFGTAEIVNAGTTYYTDVDAFDSARVMMTYRNDSTSKGVVSYGEVSDTDIAYDLDEICNATNTNYNSIAALDSTRFAVAYNDTGNGYKGTVVIGEVSGGVVTFGSEYIFNDAQTSEIGIIALDNSHLVITYRDLGNSSFGTAVAATVSGTTVSFVDYPTHEKVFNPATVEWTSLSYLDADRFVVAYRDSGNDGKGTAVVGTVSDTDIVFGSETIFNDGYTMNVSAVSYSAPYLAIAYRDSGVDEGRAVVGTVDESDVLTFGSPQVFHSGIIDHIATAGLDPLHFVVVYQDYPNSRAGTAVVGTISGYTISFSPKGVFNTTRTDYTGVARLSASKFVVSYSEGLNGYRGMSIVGYAGE
jgi:hypothetical protein